MRSPCSHASGNLEQCPIPRPPWTPHFLNTRRLDSQHRSLSPRGTSQLHVALSWRRCSAAGYRQLLRQPDYALFRLILAHSRLTHESSVHLNALICSKGFAMVALHIATHVDSSTLFLSDQKSSSLLTLFLASSFGLQPHRLILAPVALAIDTRYTRASVDTR